MDKYFFFVLFTTNFPYAVGWPIGVLRIPFFAGHHRVVDASEGQMIQVTTIDAVCGNRTKSLISDVQGLGSDIYLVALRH